MHIQNGVNNETGIEINQKFFKNRLSIEKAFLCICTACLCIVCANAWNHFRTEGNRKNADMLAQEQQFDDFHIFTAIVLEHQGNSLTVRPTDTGTYQNPVDEIILLDFGRTDINKGDILGIAYNGEILETSPAQLGKIYGIDIISSTGSTRNNTDNKKDKS